MHALKTPYLKHNTNPRLRTEHGVLCTAAI